jgi:nitroimidazol reductase NimA-like FMN-containing flavoprotein (pyridoxamine 5'-phosphate oxidase superfamily)
VLIEEGLEILDESEAMRLLANSEVGRVGVTMGALPAIFPVNYRLLDGAVVFWSSAGSKLSAAATGAVVAFEVDDYNVADRSGRSVLVVGPSEVVDDPDVAFKALAAGLAPFVDGARSTIIRIEPTLVSGRRIVHVPPGGGSRSW